MTSLAPMMDIGVNLTDRRFQKDMEDVLQRSREAGVRALVLTGTSVPESQAALSLCRGAPGLFCTAGIHPHQARDASTEALGEIRAMLEEPEVRAVGETGLDFNRDFSPRQDQERSFEAHLNLAADSGKPLFLHQRDAHERFLPMLKEWRDRVGPVVVHCFTDSKRALFDYLDLDCHIGITGWICDERRGKSLQELVVNIPAGRLLLETDSPYLMPRDYPDKAPVKGRNEPAFLPWIAAQVARFRGDDVATLRTRIWENSLAFFSVDPGQVTS